MTSRKKRLKKGIESLEKRKQEHLQKIEEEKKKGAKANELLIAYWGGEIKTFEFIKKKKGELLKKKK